MLPVCLLRSGCQERRNVSNNFARSSPTAMSESGVERVGRVAHARRVVRRRLRHVLSRLGRVLRRVLLRLRVLLLLRPVLLRGARDRLASRAASRGVADEAEEADGSSSSEEGVVDGDVIIIII